MNCLGLMLHTFLHHHGFFIAIKIFNFMLKGAHGDSQNTSDFFASKKKKMLRNKRDQGAKRVISLQL